MVPNFLSKNALVFLAIVIISVTAAAQNKIANKPDPKPSFATTLQTVVVVSDDWDNTTASASLFERKNLRSSWKRNGESFPVVLGRSGMAWADLLNGDIDMAKIKQEGDGNSPAGVFPLTSAFGTGPKPAASKMPYTKLDEYTECVDDVKSSFYNRIVNRMQVGNFDWKSSEKMASIVPEYDLGVFVAYNTYPVEKGRGSCIFLHIWKDAATPTAGCTAMERRNMERVVAWLSPAKNPFLVQMPRKIYDSRQKAWKLPKLN